MKRLLIYVKDLNKYKKLIQSLQENFIVLLANNGEIITSLINGEGKPDIILFLDIDDTLMLNNISTAAPTLICNDHIIQGLDKSRVSFIPKNSENDIIIFNLNMLFDRVYNMHVFTDEVKQEMKVQDQLVESLAIGLGAIAEFSNPDINNHILKVGLYMEALCRSLVFLGNKKYRLTDQQIQHLKTASYFHDIGKVRIPNAIASKPSYLTDEEYKATKTHSRMGYYMLDKGIDSGIKSPILKYAKNIALTHHEHWDGSGYPVGNTGTFIPLEGRLMAVVDVYDALTTQKIYKPALDHYQARDVIVAGSGTHYDPVIIKAFQAAENEFLNISQN